MTLTINPLWDAADGGDKDARDMRDMEMERRLREGKDTVPWTGLAGFEKHTKVCFCFISWQAVSWRLQLINVVWCLHVWMNRVLAARF